MKPTAEQVIEEFDALPPDEKQRVYVNITQRGNDIPSVEVNNTEGSVKYINYLRRVMARIPRQGVKGRLRAKRIEHLRSPTAPFNQKMLWKGILIGFVPNQFVSNYTEIWLLESILGSVVVRDRLREEPILDAAFVEQLFHHSPYSFYLNQAESYLFSDYDELDEAEGGPLKQLTAFNALQRYGLKILEEAKEKQYVRL